jgi:glycosyltransferase involved in cell wall biosynthesis
MNATYKGSISVVLPVYNEAESIDELLGTLFSVLKHMDRRFEVLAVNDGSIDASQVRLAAFASDHAELQVLEFRSNRGQTAALQAGIDHATGSIIVFMDADLQNDPEDIPRLVAKLEEGFDVVSGWRADRKDARVKRNLVSRIANSLISRVSGVALRDYGCTLKAYRREVLAGSHRLYGEMHRFIPIYASWSGARIVEIPVAHHPRKYGRSNYGLERTTKVLLDLLNVMFMQRYFDHPLYFFGGFGLVAILTGLVLFGYMLYLKFVSGISMILTPLPVLVAIFVLIGGMSILAGLLAEIMVRIYYESQNRRTYRIKRHLNGRADAEA